jgi:hypothetical protein
VKINFKEMKMKKVLGVLTLSVAMLVFATAAMAANPSNQFDITVLDGGRSGCNTCMKCALQNVPCPSTIYGEQGSVSVTDVCPFDYDDQYGYCPNQDEITADGEGISKRKCRLIFNICDCPESCNLVPGEKVGVQMTILTTGVYWADDSNSYAVSGSDTDRTVWFKNFKTISEACAPDRDVVMTKNFGKVKYYRSITEKVNSKGLVERTLNGEGVPASGCFAGAIPSANKVKVLESERASDYQIKASDSGALTDSDDGLCQFWIDIPAMRLDGTEAKAGDVIKVRVSLLTNRTYSGICSACDQPNICECVVSVGVVCCTSKSSTSGCFFFPYVLQGLQETQGWVSGVAVSATGTIPAGAYCKLTLKDQDGNIATWTKSDMGNSLVWAFVLDSVMSNFGKKMTPGACSLKVESNYPIDGYTFMNANMQFGTGTMPRGCGTSCNP